MKQKFQITRRDFLQLAAAAPLAAVAASDKPFAPPLAVFSKVYQEVKLTFEQSAEVTAAAGLDGIDCAVRPGGEILPEKAADDMPRYDEALRKHGVKMLLLTTAITGAASPYAETILRTAKKLGISHYRIGYWKHTAGADPKKLVEQVRAQLNELAAMNRDIGVCAIFQHHSQGRSKTPYVGGDLAEMRQIMDGMNPDHMGIAFDAGHAVQTHGDDWPKHFEALKPWIKIAYVKDAGRTSGFVRFGQGDINWPDFFAKLRRMNYRAPLSIHIEYEWSPKDRDTLLKNLIDCTGAVRRWLGAQSAALPSANRPL